jgi:hypothetical protein
MNYFFISNNQMSEGGGDLRGSVVIMFGFKYKKSIPFDFARSGLLPSEFLFVCCSGSISCWSLGCWDFSLLRSPSRACAPSSVTE